MEKQSSTPPALSSTASDASTASGASANTTAVLPDQKSADSSQPRSGTITAVTSNDVNAAGLNKHRASSFPANVETEHAVLWAAFFKETGVF